MSTLLRLTLTFTLFIYIAQVSTCKPCAIVISSLKTSEIMVTRASKYQVIINVSLPVVWRVL